MEGDTPAIHDHWADAAVVAACRSQSDAVFGFRQFKDPHVVSIPPMHHCVRGLLERLASIGETVTVHPQASKSRSGQA